MSSTGLSRIRKIQMYCKSPAKGHRGNAGTGAPHIEKAEKNGTAQPGEERAQGDLANVHCYLKRECTEMIDPGSCQ